MSDVSSTYRFCPNCGMESVIGHSFCGGCGRPVTTAAFQPPANIETGQESALVPVSGWFGAGDLTSEVTQPLALTVSQPLIMTEFDSPATVQYSTNPDAPAVSPVAPTRPGSMTGLRWMNAGALVLGAIGLLLSWAGIGILSVTGIDTNDGKLFGGILIVTALLGLWYVLRTNHIAAVLLLLGWVALLSLGVYEIVNIASVKIPLFGSVDVGAGLYVDAVAGLIGTITAAMDVRLSWSKTAARTTWLLWATGVVAAVAAIGAGIGGHNAHNAVTDTAGNGQVGNQGNSRPGGKSGTPGRSGSSGNSGSFGNSGNSGVFGNSGTSGGSGNSGAFGNSGNSGSFGNSGNSGSFGNSGNSGSFGNSGNSGSFGNSGNSGSFGNSGVFGNSD